MIKRFCDICGAETADQYASVTIEEKDRKYTSLHICLPCFYDKSQWNKIHKQPEKRIPLSIPSFKKWQSSRNKRIVKSDPALQDK